MARYIVTEVNRKGNELSIVVPVQPDVHDGPALRAAIACAHKTDSRILAVVYRPAHEFAAEAVNDEVDRLSILLDDADVAYTILPITSTDDIAAKIVSIAHEESAELVVVTLERKPAKGRLVMGSDLQKLFLEAPCPILTVRPDTCITTSIPAIIESI